MALGTAEATPLQVATAYTTFANLGDRVMPTPITQITNGEGTTVVASQPEKKNVVRSDVAYIMNDIMKDVINRGTAAEAQAWGFKNVDGKTAFAGKTGTSRDGWFAGFTPDLVCVVYVGFDDGDDLGMKGSDSAMPIWADFMKETLSRYPEWNGDWVMPAGVRKAEIDIRNGSLIRELDFAEAANLKPNPSPSASATPGPADDPAWATSEIPEPPEVFVTDVPAEFKRIELFVAGTIPNKALLKTDEGEILYDPETGEPITPTPTPEKSPTPIEETWEGQLEPTPSPRRPGSSREAQNVMVIVCPLTGLRATAACPKQEMRNFQQGKEPRDFCALHR